jgi:hypothetical protein
MTEEKFKDMLNKQERLSKEPYDDKTLEQFVRKPKKLNLYDKIKSVVDFILLFFLFVVICVVSVISSVKGAMEVYVAVPIAFLSIIGIIILVIDTKRKV